MLLLSLASIRLIHFGINGMSVHYVARRVKLKTIYVLNVWTQLWGIEAGRTEVQMQSSTTEMPRICWRRMISSKWQNQKWFIWSLLHWHTTRFFGGTIAPQDLSFSLVNKHLPIRLNVFQFSPFLPILAHNFKSLSTLVNPYYVFLFFSNPHRKFLNFFWSLLIP